jgi:hypothetical protein
MVPIVIIAIIEPSLDLPTATPPLPFKRLEMQAS